MNKTSSKKMLLFTRILPTLKKQSAYFSLAAVKRALDASEIRLADDTLREYMSEARASGIVSDAGRGWYSRHEKPVSLDPKPVAKVIRDVKKAFPLLDFCCWSTVQFNPFAQHLIAQPTLVLYAESDSLESIAETLRETGWNAWANPMQKDIERFVRPGEKTVILRPSISKQPVGDNHEALIEKVLVDLMVEAPKLQLMDVGEAQLILDNVFRAGIVQVALMIGYSEIRGISLTSQEITH